MTQLLDRSFAGPVELDGHELVGRVVPWGETARIAEFGDDGKPTAYVERFERGAFEPQLTSGNPGVVRNVEFRDQHEGGYGKLGYALELQDRDDGLWGRFRIGKRDIDYVREAVEDGVNGLSVRFHPLRGGTRNDDGIVSRIRAYLDHVALVATPAYASARVTMARSDGTTVTAEEALVEEAAAEARRADLDDLDAFLARSREAGERWTAGQVVANATTVC